jgi:hypothetical protein
MGFVRRGQTGWRFAAFGTGAIQTARRALVKSAHKKTAYDGAVTHFRMIQSQRKKRSASTSFDTFLMCAFVKSSVDARQQTPAAPRNTDG